MLALSTMSEEDTEVLFLQDSTRSNGSINGHDFDDIVGFLEGILVDDSFVQAQNQLFDKHQAIFTEDEENKLEYMDVFQQYCEIMENHIEDRLAASFAGISTAEVARALIERAEDVTDDVVEMLVSITDFKEFKDLIISYKNQASFNVLPVEK